MVLTIVRYLFFALAGLSALAAIVFVFRALFARSLSLKKVYGVARQNERQRMMLYAYYSIGWFILGLLFVGIGSLTLLGGGDEPIAAIDPTPAAEVTPTRAEQVEVVATNTSEQVESTATPEPALTEPATENTVSAEQPASPEPPATAETSVVGDPTPTAEPEAGPDPSGETAIVNSPIVGLYLRAVPSGEILERLEDQAIVTSLNEQQIVDGIEWVKVAAQSGNEGWVAAEFLDFGDSP